MVVVAAALFRLSLGEGFNEYISRVELARLSRVEDALAERYANAGGWDFVRGPRDLMPDPPDGRPPPFEGPPGADMQRRPPNDRLDFGPRLALFDAHGQLILGPREAQGRPRRAVHEQNGEQIIGYIALAPIRAPTDDLTQQFLQSQTRNLIGIAALAILASALAAWFLARHFRAPIAALASGARNLAAGKLDTRVNLNRRDELGELAVDFNTMAQRLERFEQSRRQWVADTSHELRTPLTILRAHSQAMRDGIMPFNPRGLEVIDSAVAEMEALVSDLFQLARADVGSQDYQVEPVILSTLFDDVVQRFAEPMRQAGLAFTVQTPPDVLLKGDPTRLQQLLSNLLLNATRYTDKGGEVKLAAKLSGPLVEITLDDSPPGVPASALAHLFERFYRVDASRSRRGGGAGLGLAICQSIVNAHGGRIVAEPSPLGGLRIVITLPMLDKSRSRT